MDGVKISIALIDKTRDISEQCIANNKHGMVTQLQQYLLKVVPPENINNAQAFLSKGVKGLLLRKAMAQPNYK